MNESIGPNGRVEETGDQENSSVILLRKWADKYDVDDDPYVAGLLEDMPSEQNLSMWAERNPFDHLPYPPVEKIIRKLLNWVSLIRNALVFVPVAITWLALSRAIGEFQSAPPGTNFIRFWESGRAGGAELFSIWRLSNVAVIDFALISLVILLTVVIGFLSDKSERRESTEREQIDKEREELAIQIAKTLSRKHWVTPESFEEAFANTLNKLTSAISSVDIASVKLEETAQTVYKASRGVEGLYSRLETLSDSVDKTNSNFTDLASRISGDLSQTISSFEKSVTEMNEATRRDLQNMGQQMINVRTELFDKLLEVSRTFEGLASQITDLPTLLRNQMTSLGAGISQESESAIAVVTDFNNRVTHDFSKKASQILDDMEIIHERYRTANRSMEVGVSQLNEDLQGIQNVLVNIKEGLDASDDEDLESE